jgi:two-component system, sensor histidine kinase ChiS
MGKNGQTVSKANTNKYEDTSILQSTLLRNILESPKDIVIFAWDKNYCYLAFNENHRNTMKHIWNVDIQIGICMLDYIGHFDDRKKAKINFDRALKGEDFTLIEIYGDENINRCYYQDVYSPIYSDSDQVIGLTLYLTDITKQRKIEIELENYRTSLEKLVDQRTEQLQKASRIKDEFLANTSHELRTPLHGILGLCSNLSGNITQATHSKFTSGISTIEVCAHRLLRLINDILDVAKLRHQQIQLSHQAVKLPELFQNIQAIYQPLAAKKNLKLSIKCTPNIANVWADADRLQQILHNLLGNALKFTTQGSISITASVQQHTIIIAITDTGIGIEQEAQQVIFSAFTQGNNSLTYAQGTGLGLSITQQLVKLHGSQLYLDSTPGVGSCFSFALAITDKIPKSNSTYLTQLAAHCILSSPSAAVVADNPIQPFNILVVDDDPINVQILIDHLATAGYSTSIACNGQEALSKLAQQCPDMILLDIMMPVMDGFSACSKIRQQYTKQELPIVFVTAKNQVDDFLHGLAIGGNDYLVKPFSQQELYARIDNLLSLLTQHRRIKQVNEFWQNYNTTRGAYALLADKIIALLQADIHILGVNFYQASSLGHQDFNAVWLTKAHQLAAHKSNNIISATVYHYQDKYALVLEEKILCHYKIDILFAKLPSTDDIAYLTQVMQQLVQLEQHAQPVLSTLEFKVLSDFTSYSNQWLWIQAQQKVSLIKLTTGAEKIIDCTLKTLCHILPGSECVQVHRSYLVAVQHIKKSNIRRCSTSKYELMIDNKIIPIGQSYWSIVKKLLA